MLIIREKIPKFFRHFVSAVNVVWSNLCVDLTQRLDHTTLTAETKYPINFTQWEKRFLSNLHYNGNKSFLFVNTTKVYQLKAKYSERKDHALCLGNISKDFTINNMTKTGF